MVTGKTVRQKTIIKANSEDELKMRIQDLVDRGWSLQNEIAPTKKEQKHFSYHEARKGFQRRYQGSDFIETHRAAMVRDYPVTK